MPVYEFGSLRLETESHALTCDGEPVRLPPRLFAILLTLVESNGRVVSQDDLRSRVWPESFVEDAAVIKNVSTLRTALRRYLPDTPVIRTLPKRGYQLLLPVTQFEEVDLSVSLTAGPPQTFPFVERQADVERSEPAPTAATNQPLPKTESGRSEMAEAIPSAAEPGIDEMPAVVSRSRSLYAYALTAFAILSLVAGASWFTARRAARLRPVVAVLSLHNLTPGSGQAWIGVGVEESLRSNLERDNGATTLTGLQVAEAERDLPAVSTGVLDTAQIQAFGRRLHCNYIVTGFYTTVGNELRLDLQMRDAATGEVRSTTQEVSPTGMLFAQSHRIADQFRAALHRPALTSPRVVQAQERDVATSDYWEGLRLLRQDRYVEAAETLSRAVAASPQSPLAHIALASALQQMGYEGRAADEARTALQFASDLPHEEHLRLRALAAEYKSDWKPAAAGYTELRGLDAGNSDYVLGANRALISLGHPQEAADDLARFVHENSAAKTDARFSLMQASAAAALTDHHSELIFAGDALRLARSSSARHLETQALIREGWAWAFFGDELKAEVEAEQALKIAEAIGNIPDILSASSQLGQVQASFPDPRAKATLQHALDVARRAGARLAESGLLVALGNLADEDENYVAERDYNQRALDITISLGLLTPQLPELMNLAEAADSLGNYTAERTYCERVVAISKASGNQEMLNHAHLALSRLAVRADDLPLARAELATAMAAANRMDSKEQIAEALQAMAQLALEEGKIAQARQLADQVTAMHVIVRSRIVEQKLLISELEIREGHIDAAIQRVKELAVSPTTTVYPTSVAWRLTAEANLLKGNLSDARTAVEAAIASARHEADPADDLVPALLLRARIESASSNALASETAIHEAKTMAKRANAPRALHLAESLKM